MLGRPALSAASLLFVSFVAAAACSKADNTDAALDNGNNAGAAGQPSGGSSGAGASGKGGASAAGKGGAAGTSPTEGGASGASGTSGKGGASGKAGGGGSGVWEDGGAGGEAGQAGASAGAGGDAGQSGAGTGGTDGGASGSGSGASGSGGTGGIPGWTCGPSLYDELSKGEKYPQCNCECGLYDPDCESPFSYVKGCDKGQTCGKSGLCEGEKAVVPSTWTCGSAYYAIGGKAPVCNCGCGAPDPDCHLPTYSSDLTKCGRGQTCAGDGTCTGPILEVPAGWTTCKPSKFAEGKTSGTCDCDCGAPDPDCADPYLPMTGCGYGQTCEAGVCKGEVLPDPDGWGCAKGTYSDGKICNCACGPIRDPDCNFLYDKLPDDCGEGSFCLSTKNECF